MLAIEFRSRVPVSESLIEFHKLTIREGISDTLIDQLISISNNDAVILRFTSDGVRFRDRNAFCIWLNKGRAIYTLCDPNANQLLGMVWFGKEDLPCHDFEFTKPINPNAYTNTIAKRLYSEARGKGYAHDFMVISLAHYLSRNINENTSGFWSETSADNQTNIRVNNSLGFNCVTTPNARNKILMVASCDDVLFAIGR